MANSIHALCLLLAWLLPTIVVAGEAPAAFRAEFAGSVFKVQARDHHGRVALGSATLIAPHVLVTNCHVVRQASSVLVVNGTERRRAEVLASDVDHDLCLLSAPEIQGKIAAFGDTRKLRPGQHIFAAGYPDGGDMLCGAGHIHALYSHDGAQVIRGSAPFDHGASGGGLFDEDGRLIGILTFKARAGGSFHFAVPVEWVTALLSGQVREGVSTAVEAFWERSKDRQLHFLRAASIEAQATRSAPSGHVER